MPWRRSFPTSIRWGQLKTLLHLGRGTTRKPPGANLAKTFPRFAFWDETIFDESVQSTVNCPRPDLTGVQGSYRKCDFSETSGILGTWISVAAYLYPDPRVG
jgi:hypothetical protein